MRNGTEQRKALSTETDSTLDQAQNVVRQMEMVIRNASMSTQVTHYRSRVKQYDADIQRHRHSLLTAVPATGAPGLDRDKFYDTYSRAEATNRRLMNTEQKAYESEEIGAAIMSDLHSQREKLEGVDGKLSSIDGTMDRTHGKLYRLGMRVMTDKIILWVIIGIEAVTIFCMVFFKWIIKLFPDKNK